MRIRSAGLNDQSAPIAPTRVRSMSAVFKASAKPSAKKGSSGLTSRQFRCPFFHQETSSIAAGREQATVLLSIAQTKKASDSTYHVRLLGIESGESWVCSFALDLGFGLATTGCEPND